MTSSDRQSTTNVHQRFGYETSPFRFICRRYRTSNRNARVSFRISQAMLAGEDMRRVWLPALSTIVIALACAPLASADRVFTVKGASAPGPAKYDRVRVIE